MKYERLTKRDERGFSCIKGVSPENLYKGFDDMNVALSVTWAVKRLAELEDKMESGELIERTSEECSAVRKQAVRKFVEEFKSRYFFMMATCIEDPIYQCTGDELDRLVKEVCGE